MRQPGARTTAVYRWRFSSMEHVPGESVPESQYQLCWTSSGQSVLGPRVWKPTQLEAKTQDSWNLYSFIR